MGVTVSAACRKTDIRRSPPAAKATIPIPNDDGGRVLGNDNQRLAFVN